MRRRRRVVWALPANLDLVEIVELIAEESPKNARRIIKRIRERVAKLETLPERGRVVPELSKQGITSYRELVISPWRVVYRTDEKTVHVVLAVDGRRNLEDVLFKRLMR